MEPKNTPKLNIDKSLDKLDLQIIQAMMEDAEVSYADLGKQFFVSGGTIHVRIKKLEELGIVKGKRLAVDLKVLGYDIIIHGAFFKVDPDKGDNVVTQHF